MGYMDRKELGYGWRHTIIRVWDMDGGIWIIRVWDMDGCGKEEYGLYGCGTWLGYMIIRMCKNLQLIYESQDVSFWCVFQCIVKYRCVLSVSNFQSRFSMNMDMLGIWVRGVYLLL